VALKTSSIQARATIAQLSSRIAAFALAFLVTSGLVLPTSQTANAANVQRIAAVVNDEVISAYDVDQRVLLVLATSGIEPKEEIVNRIREQVLRTLIDEKLQMQEASNADLKISEEQVDAAVTRLARQNNLTVEQIYQVLAQSGINRNTLRDQLRAELAWRELVGQRFGPRVSISEAEIDSVLERIAASKDRPEFLVAEIFLSVDNPADEAQVREDAENLIEQMVSGGANFQGIAQQFSQAASAATGGDIGWVSEAQLQPELVQVLTNLQPGQITVDPVRTVSGFYVLLLRDKRIAGEGDPLKITLSMEQIVVPVSGRDSEAEQRRKLQKAASLVESPPKCGEIKDLVKSDRDLRGANLGTVRVEDLTPAFQRAVKGRLPGQVSQPIPSPAGLHILFICDRVAAQEGLPSREAIEDQLYSQELSMMARRYLRDLRRDATIDQRL